MSTLNYWKNEERSLVFLLSVRMNKTLKKTANRVSTNDFKADQNRHWKGKKLKTNFKNLNLEASCI